MACSGSAIASLPTWLPPSGGERRHPFVRFARIPAHHAHPLDSEQHVVAVFAEDVIAALVAVEEVGGPHHEVGLGAPEDTGAGSATSARHR
jgi:hypothetical protein